MLDGTEADTEWSVDEEEEEELKHISARRSDSESITGSEPREGASAGGPAAEDESEKMYSADDAKVGLKDAAAATHSKLSKYSRSVDSIMDRIDSELSRLKPAELPLISQSRCDEEEERMEGFSASDRKGATGSSTNQDTGKQPRAVHAGGETESGGGNSTESSGTAVGGLGVGGKTRLRDGPFTVGLRAPHGSAIPVLKEHRSRKFDRTASVPRELRLSKELQDILGTSESGQEKDDSDYLRRREPDLALHLPADSDVDSDVALEINEQYGEIMKSKQVPNAPPLTSFSVGKLPSRPEGYPEMDGGVLAKPMADEEFLAQSGVNAQATMARSLSHTETGYSSLTEETLRAVDAASGGHPVRKGDPDTMSTVSMRTEDFEAAFNHSILPTIDSGAAGVGANGKPTLTKITSSGCGIQRTANGTSFPQRTHGPVKALPLTKVITGATSGNTSGATSGATNRAMPSYGYSTDFNGSKTTYTQNWAQSASERRHTSLQRGDSIDSIGAQTDFKPLEEISIPATSVVSYPADHRDQTGLLHADLTKLPSYEVTGLPDRGSYEVSGLPDRGAVGAKTGSAHQSNHRDNQTNDFPAFEAPPESNDFFREGCKSGDFDFDSVSQVSYKLGDHEAHVFKPVEVSESLNVEENVDTLSTLSVTTEDMENHYQMLAPVPVTFNSTGRYIPPKVRDLDSMSVISAKTEDFESAFKRSAVNTDHRQSQKVSPALKAVKTGTSMSAMKRAVPGVGSKTEYKGKYKSVPLLPHRLTPRLTKKLSQLRKQQKPKDDWDCSSLASSMRTDEFSKSLGRSLLPAPRRIRSFKHSRPKPSPDFDADSVKTEDFVNAFRDTNGQASLQSGVEIDSPRTEEYETKFRSVMVKQLAGVPMTSFDPMTVDSDLDTVKSDLINHMFRGKKDTETLEDFSDLEADFFPSQGEDTEYAGETDSEIELANEITEASSRIKRELELERKSRGHVSSNPALAAAVGPRRTTVQSNGTSPSGRMSKGLGGRITRGHKETIGKETAGRRGVSSSAENYNGYRGSSGASDGGLLHLQDETMVLEELGATIKNAHREKMSLLQEVDQLHDTMEKLRDDMARTQSLVKDNRSRAEEARSQLMLAEFKKETVCKELSRLTGELEQKKDKSREVDAKIRNQNMMGKEEFADLVEERNQLRSLMSKQNGTLQLEKEAIERQYMAGQDELLNVQKTHRAQVEALEEVVSTLKERMQESHEEQATLLYRCKTAETRVTQDQTNHTEAIKEKIRECEELREQSKRDMLEARLEHSMEITRLNKNLSTEEDKSKKLEGELKEHQTLLTDLREQLGRMDKDLGERKNIEEKLKKESEEEMKTLKALQERELESLEKKARREREETITMLKGELESVQDELLSKMQSSYDRKVEQLETALTKKEVELSSMYQRSQDQMEAGHTAEEQLKAHHKIKLDDALARERELWEREQKFLAHQENVHYKEEAGKQQAQLREEVDRERSQVRQLNQQNAALRVELEEQRQQNQALYKDKLTAVTQTKEKAAEDKKYEVERARQAAREEVEGAAANLRRELDAKDELLGRLEVQVEELLGREKDADGLLDKMEKTLLSEMNEECRKTALVLGVSPRRASTTGAKLYGNKGHKRTLSRSLTTSALANMRACNDELRSHVNEVQRDLEAVKLQVHKIQKAKDIELENLRIEMQKEKVQDMDELKDRLIQISVKTTPQSQNGQTPPTSTMVLNNGESPYTERTEREARRTSSERKSPPRRPQTAEPHKPVYEDEHSRSIHFDDEPSASHHQRHRSPHRQSNSTASMLKSLQSRVRSLQRDHSPQKEERPFHHHDKPPPSASRSPSKQRLSSFSTSTPDLTLRNARQAADASFTQSMEQKLRLAELRAQLAEERANRNQELLGQKIEEISQIQNTREKPTHSSKDRRRGYSNHHTSY